MMPLLNQQTCPFAGNEIRHRAGKCSYVLDFVLFYSASRWSGCDQNYNQWTAACFHVIPKDKNKVFCFLKHFVFDPSVKFSGTNFRLFDKALSKKSASSVLGLRADFLVGAVVHFIHDCFNIICGSRKIARYEKICWLFHRILLYSGYVRYFNIMLINEATPEKFNPTKLR